MLNEEILVGFFGFSIEWLEVTGGLDGFENVVMYKDCLRSPTNANSFSQFKARGIKMDERLISYVIAWILVPRGNNHAQLTIDDLLMLHALKKGIQVDWSAIVVDKILKTRRMLDFQLPYAVFITKVMEHYGVDFTNNKLKILNSINKINDIFLHHMHLVEMDDHWYYKDDASKPKVGEIPASTSNEKPLWPF